ncbi:hypothetical protein [Serratia sp. S119]|uniref:hypothetical protein n=1 Tax=Serratia sp. S119 TaxID=1118230 RepID=UPI00097BBAC6|nr:hypothetical protein [Serratia sp. S119]ONK18424.1 hypothetical protein BHT35_2741 [Serratia sp. S119]
MKQTLTTTEELKHLASSDNANELTRRLARECLANREAQPVLYASEETLAYAKEGEKSLVTWSEPMGDAVIPLYTAPPAPANAAAWEMRYWNSGHNMWHEWERITAEQHAEMSVKHAADNDYEFRVLYDAPPAPKSNAADWGINMQTGTPILVYKTCSVIESEQAHYVLSLINSAAPPAPAVPGIDELRLTFERSERESDDGFNLHKYGIGYADEATQARWESWLACRAEMLAQPVSSGYKLPPHVYRELVNSLRDTAVKFSGSEQLRERLNTALSQFIEPDHHHMRTAATKEND